MAVSTVACHTTKAVTVEMAPAKNPVWLTLNDQSVTILYGPQIYGNKLVGFVAGKYQEFPIDQVKELHAREPARGRTMALVAAGVAGAAVVLYAAAGHLHSAPDTHMTDLCDESPDDPSCQ
jgi:hypothetical protein